MTLHHLNHRDATHAAVQPPPPPPPPPGLWLPLASLRPALSEPLPPCSVSDRVIPWGPRVSGTAQYLCFCVWLPSPSTTFSTLIHIVADVRIPFLFTRQMLVPVTRYSGGLWSCPHRSWQTSAPWLCARPGPFPVGAAWAHNWDRNPRSLTSRMSMRCLRL